MKRTLVFCIALATLLAAATPVSAQLPAPDPRRSGTIFVQCPGDTNGDAIPDKFLDPPTNLVPNPAYDPSVKCMHLAAGDGFVTMADERKKPAEDRAPLYIFSFSDMTGVLPGNVMNEGSLAASFTAPTITLKEGQEFYLNLSNVGMVMRPDLSDAHSVHFHGFPQAAPVFDGVPETSVTINQTSSFTYYYKIVEPGTYMYHCHFEATEHMQMGMLGNLYVEPRQNACSPTSVVNGLPNPCPADHVPGTKYVYNDGDRSTRYDVEYPVQIGSFDPEFHNASETVQPLPFAIMKDRYPMLNGRGYPDTINPLPLSTPTDRNCSGAPGSTCRPSQPLPTLIEAKTNQRVLLRISSLVTTRFYTLASTIPMKVVGHNARLHRGPSGKDLSYTTTSVTLGGGESIDVILDTTGLAPGTYLLYTTNLNYLSNDAEDYGGMMTEIRITS